MMILVILRGRHGVLFRQTARGTREVEDFGGSPTTVYKAVIIWAYTFINNVLTGLHKGALDSLSSEGI